MSIRASSHDLQSIPFVSRKWQLEAQRELSMSRKKGQQDFLVVAAPSAGKTRFALESARKLLNEGAVGRVVIVCHSDHLRKQWARVAESFGMKIDPRFSNADGVESSEYQGVVVTYQQVVAASDLFRMNCNHRQTLAILDEVHHVGDRRPWARAVQNAFEVAHFRLAMSGTLFREDGRRIPFVQYVDGVSRPDYVYGYAQGIADKVCRPIYFETFSGDLVWLRDGREELHEHSMLDVVDRATAAERLLVALDPSKEWLRHVLAKADEHLTAIRESGHENAGGVIFAKDQDHARRIARLVEKISGETPVLAISKDPEASDKIIMFAEGTQRWIVAVRMLSEGVDIPRLRIGVYATNVRTELFFRQVVGRLIRYTPGLREQSAVLFMPADQTLIHYALFIKEEREHVLLPDGEEDEAESGVTEILGKEWGEILIKALSAEAEEHDAIFDGKSFVQPELKYAARACKEMGITTPFVYASALIRLGASLAGIYVRHELTPASQVSEPPARGTPRLLKLLRERVNAAAQKLADQLNVTADDIHEEWVRLMGGSPPDTATREDLELKLDWLKHRYADEAEAKGHKVGRHYFSSREIKERVSNRSALIESSDLTSH